MLRDRLNPDREAKRDRIKKKDIEMEKQMLIITAKKIIYLTDKGQLLTLDFLKINHEWENNLMYLVNCVDDEKLNKLLYNLPIILINLNKKKYYI